MDELRAAQERTDTFDVETVVNHFYKPASSKAKKNLFVTVKWRNYEETTIEPVASNKQLCRTQAFRDYAATVPILQGFIPK